MSDERRTNMIIPVDLKRAFEDAAQKEYPYTLTAWLIQAGMERLERLAKPSARR